MVQFGITVFEGVLCVAANPDYAVHPYERAIDEGNVSNAMYILTGLLGSSDGGVAASPGRVVDLCDRVQKGYIWCNQKRTLVQSTIVQ